MELNMFPRDVQVSALLQTCVSGVQEPVTSTSASLRADGEPDVHAEGLRAETGEDSRVRLHGVDHPLRERGVAVPGPQRHCSRVQLHEDEARGEEGRRREDGAGGGAGHRLQRHHPLPTSPALLRVRSATSY